MTATGSLPPSSEPEPALRHAMFDSVIGGLRLVARGQALTGVYFPDHWHLPADLDHGQRVELDTDPVLGSAARQLREYFNRTRTEFELSLQPRGDAFRQRVWRRLQRIPYGRRTSYGTIAAELGNPGLAQRVGQAVGSNPLSIVVPCHRVVGADGSLTGFAGGLDRKRFLLELEEPEDRRAQRLF